MRLIEGISMKVLKTCFTHFIIWNDTIQEDLELRFIRNFETFALEFWNLNFLGTGSY